MSRLNYFETLRFNIRAFGLRRGIKLPIYIYGPIKVYGLGRIQIDVPLRRGIVIIGKNQQESAASHTIINNQGTIIIKGKLFLNFGCVLNNKGTISFMGNDILSQTTKVLVYDGLEVGRNVSIGNDSVITDSDVHYTIDINGNVVKRNHKPIKIGNFNWFGSYTHVKKGTVTPDYTMTASPNTVLCKDYSHIPPYSVLAGCPAKPIKEGLRRVYNFKSEQAIQAYFDSHPEKEYYEIPKGTELDQFCKLF